MLNEDEIKEVIQGVLTELEITVPTGKDKGRIMKVLMPKVKALPMENWSIRCWLPCCSKPSLFLNEAAALYAAASFLLI